MTTSFMNPAVQWTFDRMGAVKPSHTFKMFQSVAVAAAGLAVWEQPAMRMAERDDKLATAYATNCTRVLQDYRSEGHAWTQMDLLRRNFSIPQDLSTPVAAAAAKRPRHPTEKQLEAQAVAAAKVAEKEAKKKPILWPFPDVKLDAEPSVAQRAAQAAPYSGDKVCTSYEGLRRMAINVFGEIWTGCVLALTSLCV